MKEMWNGRRWIERLSDLYQADGRRHERFRTEFQASLTGSFGAISVTGSDVNRDGAGVHSPSPLPLDSLVFLRITDLGLMGFAHVRHCSKQGAGYRLGLQFREQLTREQSAIEPCSILQLAQAAGPAWNEAEF